MIKKAESSIKSDSRSNESGPHPVDIHVGQRLRLQRTLRGLTQTELANALGITFQQIQKYEKGSNRISASRLFEVSRHLGVEVSYFFDDFDESAILSGQLKASGPTAQVVMSSTESGPTIDGIAMDRSTVKVVKAFCGIKDDRTRSDIYQLLKTLSNADNNRS